MPTALGRSPRVRRAQIGQREQDEEIALLPLSDLRRQIRRGVHRSVQALEKDIRTWIAARNTDPKPYVWTKTADEILERRAGYLNRIPDSEGQGTSGLSE